MMTESDTGNSVESLASPLRRDTPYTPRRSFLGLLVGVGTATVGVLLSVPVVGYVLHPLLRVTTPLACEEVGGLEDFASATYPVKK
jgi:hypothetical protein